MPITWNVEQMEWAADGTITAAHVRVTITEADKLGTLARTVFLGDKVDLDTVTEDQVLVMAKQRLDVAGMELAAQNQITPPQASPVVGRGLPWKERERAAAEAAAQAVKSPRRPDRGVP